jgi:uncharacterized protein YbaR (Trm112 family)
MQTLTRIREAMELIVCPVCHGSLLLQQSAQENAVVCSGCGRRYPIEDGIPILLEARATTKS